jgi:NAD(P)-dependent dehydrogenase (short-subunit alcohol dehydrogenase family)
MNIKYPEELNFLNSGKQPILISDVSIQGKVVVLTGATSGVGLQAAYECADHGARLILVARSVSKAQTVAKSCLERGAQSVDIVIADLSLLSQVRTSAQKIAELTPSIDVIIHSAGMHSTKRVLTQEGLEVVFALNHCASFLLTVLLIPQLKNSPQSQVLFINSEGHRFNGLDLNDLNWKKRLYTGLRSYGASKTAQLLCMLELNDRLENSNIVVNAMHPGDVKTNIGQNNGWFYRLFSKLFIQPILKDAHRSGQAIYTLISKPELAYARNAFYHYTTLELVAGHARDRKMSPKVFLKTCELCGVDPELI